MNLKDKINSTSPNNFKTKEANDEIKNIYKKLEELSVGKVIRAEVISMSANTRIRTHKDRTDLLYLSRRFHIPIITNKNCIFTVEREQFYLEEANLYELNNRRYHSVHNNSNENRVHLIIDVLPNQYTENVSFL
jgi:aspartyl/asparaginyl beta-hydroxylase (cupin superfamily)